MNRGARLRTPVRTYLLTKAMQRRWHDLRQRHREPQLSQTGRQAFVNDSISQTLCAAHAMVEKLSLHLGQMTIRLKFLTASMLPQQQTMVFSSLTKLSSWTASM